MPELLSMQRLADGLDGVDMDVILDVRPMAAYNGWALDGEARGGHLPGAVPFPASWLESLDDSEVVHALEDRSVTPEKTIALYGHGSDDAESAAAKLESLGFKNLLVFADGLPAWAAHRDLPMARLPRFRQLVHERWLARLLSSGDPPEFDGNRHVLAHVSFDNREDYDEGHIPGAIALDTLFLEEPEHWNRRNPHELKKALVEQGITCDTTLVLYGRAGSPTMEMESPGRYAGQIAAMRAAVLLLYAGVEDVRVLDGGLAAWLAGGHTITKKETTPAPVKEFGAQIPSHPEYVVDLAGAKELLEDPKGELVSMRSWEEFIGETSGYHYIGPKGRIPGAIFGNCGSDAYHMENYRNHDNTMRCYNEIAQRWREVGVTPNKRIAFYCGTGWRASEAFFYAHLMGWNRIAVYDGGWYEWSMDEGNPVETGIPPSYKGAGRPRSLLPRASARR
jgi:thiosulfate/3-mercaptopyruvate sulfurtransferase